MKTKKLFKIIVFSIILIYMCVIGHIFWDGVFSHYIPWTRTFFISYESYDKFLKNMYDCLAHNYFIDELPVDSEDVKYYWHEDWGDKLTAYSATLSDEEYSKITDNRINAYYTAMAEQPEYVVYKASGEEVMYIEDTDWYDEEKLHFIKNLMKNPEGEKKYYFATIVQCDKQCYIGVLLNDSTQEMIEFYVNLRDDSMPYTRRVFWRHSDFMADVYKTSYCQDVPESLHDTEYFVYEGQEISKSGYRAAFSEEDYYAVKQERMKYYQTSTFDSEYEPVGDIYIYAEDSKQYLKSQCIPSERIDYLDKLLSEEEREQFYLGCSRLKDKKEHWHYQYDAVLFNDENCEIIEVSYYGPLDRILDASEEEMSFEGKLAGVLIFFVGPAILLIYVVFFVKGRPKNTTKI